MVLVGTIRPTRSVKCNVRFIDRIETARRMFYEERCQAGCSCCTDYECRRTSLRCFVKSQELHGVAKIIRH
jgi:hypothetical protein